MTSGIVLGIRLCFYNHAPEQAAIVLAFHQPATNQIGGNDLRRTTEEELRESRKILSDGLGDY